ncbi:short-chain dehydrogenase [Azospirillum thiophilum]|uniref:Short-chain dehydrogenase n=1 Tax=Azospirillum thiophilum TaxID=528244 RepID=A0AAC8ZU06_9PROT|nr:SDR family NAD(P)-dependent oxidoreductase [Azospirillum thiophilum]ALG71453.1 short-chain dehydrogenase [Azospirillum thiophilum]KJR64900.1 short-chain dehydrogenase [Azospirillum thiophilum]
MKQPRSIVITGASSGIGEALAVLYAAPGVALALTGRDSARLEEVAARCRVAGAHVAVATVDVTDRAAMADWLQRIDAGTPVDLLIANAGMSAGTGAGGETEEQARRILAVNIDGVLNSIHPLLPTMRARGRGQIALMASLAGFRGLPGAPAYCASKAMVRVYGEALRGDLAEAGIRVSVICPGFVKSRMTAVNRFPMPFLMETADAALVIRRGLERNAARIAFPWPMMTAVWLLALLPPAWADRLLRQAPRKS